MAEAQIPDGVSADYENVAARAALTAFTAAPDFAGLAEFLNAAREDYLVVDVTGTQKKKAARIRTTRTTKGQPVLPLFTSMAELRLAVPKKLADQVRGAVMPARQALALINSDRFVAAEINPGSDKLVLLRKFLDHTLADDTAERPLTAEDLESL